MIGELKGFIMHLNWLTVALVIYLTGFVFFLLQSLKTYFNFQWLKETQAFDIFAVCSVKSYLIIKPFLWPYYFILHKNPLAFFSEFFFRHYSDEDEICTGTQGLENFLNDLFKGKDRYKGYQAKILCWPVDKNEQAYRDYMTQRARFEKPGISIYAEITYAISKDKYLLEVFYEKHRSEHSTTISRFHLDHCERLTKSEFKERLLQINPEKAQQLFNQLNVN